MAETTSGCLTSENFKEAVCIDAGRVYDSCCDRDCLEDLRVYFNCEGQKTIEDAISIRIKSAEVLNVLIDVEPVNFNRGFFSCDLTFFFLIRVEVFTGPVVPVELNGIAVFNKKVILFGSHGNVRTFSNLTTIEDENDPQMFMRTNMPRCVVQAVDPIALSARLGEVKDCYEHAGRIPKSVVNFLGGSITSDLESGSPAVYVTLGLFTIVQLIRNVQMLVPVYDFCIPEKQCDDATVQPCDVFRKIKFPTDDFFPPRPAGIDSDNQFGCSSCNE